MTTSPIITQYVYQWLDTMQPQELQAKIQSDYRITDDIDASARAQILVAKKFIKFDIEPDGLLDQVLSQRPSHGKVLFMNRKWYNDQIQGLSDYISAL